MDTAKPLPMLQEPSGLEQSSVAREQGKPRRRHSVNNGVPNSLRAGWAVITAGQQSGAAPAASDSSPPLEAQGWQLGKESSRAGGSFPGS